MKRVSKIISLILVFILLFVNFYIPNVSAASKTLRQLKSELQDAETRYNNNKAEKELTQKQIQDKRNNVSAINREIDTIQQNLVNLENEIVELEANIVKKEEEIKKIMNYYQVSNGESAYLEYAFNAVDFTDFIYRMAIAEQLSKYNDQLVDQYNSLIEENKNKKVELQNKTVSLNNKQTELEKEIVTLGSHLAESMDVSVSIEEEIKSLKELVNVYENVYHCSLDESLDTCTNKLPPGTAFYRPVVSGYVSSDYGYRSYKLNGKTVSDYHYGIDFAAPHGSNVYSTANGRVAFITRKSSCGGNMVYIHHTVNGKEYTSGYFHLATINVSVGDSVTYDTVIGTVGGSPGIETWDGCSTGSHLHFQMSTTHIQAKEGFYSSFTARRVNPREIVNIPTLGTSFTSRTVKY